MTKLTKNEKILRKASKKWENFLAEGAFNQTQTQEPIDEARMGEYGKIDAEDGNPPSKIGRGNEEYMAAYNAVLQARGEEPLDIQKPDQAYLDALQRGNLEEMGPATGHVEGTDAAGVIRQIAADLGEVSGVMKNASSTTTASEFAGFIQAKANELLEAANELGIDGPAPALQENEMSEGDDWYSDEHETLADKMFADSQAAAQEEQGFQVGEFVYIVNGSLKGASGKILEPVTTSTGEEGFAIELYSDAKMKVFGKRGDEVIALPQDLESGGTTDDMELYDIDEKKNLKEEVIEDFAIELEGGLSFADVEEAGLVTPGVDSVIDNGDGYAQVYAEPQAMAKMAKTLEAMTGVMVSPQSHGAVDEEMSKKDFVQMVRDKGKVPNLKGDMGPISGLEGPFQYRSGAVLYYDPREGKYYDRGQDRYLDDQEAAELTMEDRTTMSSDPEFDQVQDIAADMLELSARSRIPVNLKSVQSALEAQSFDAQMDKGMLIVDNKYVIADKKSLPATAQKISFTGYGIDYLSNLQGGQQDLPLG